MRSLGAKLTVYISIVAFAIPAFSQSFEAWTAKAQKAQKSGDDQVAAEYWTNALRAWERKDGKSKRAKALSERAALYEKAGEADGALADLSAALKLDPKSASLYDRRGQLFLAQGKLTEAISDFYGATKLSISYGPAFYHRGLAYEQQGDAGFAKEDFRTACRLGVKDGCAKAKGQTPKAAPAPKPKKAPVQRPVAPAAAAPAASSPAPAPAAPAAAPAKAAPAVDMRACAAAVQACSDEGRAIDICVKKVKVCEREPGKGCCPELCVRQFQRESSPDRSDAELFRLLFTPKSSCAKGLAP
jgi:tetratricopeptide (TPR) repeat protein